MSYITASGVRGPAPRGTDFNAHRVLKVPNGAGTSVGRQCAGADRTGSATGKGCGHTAGDSAGEDEGARRFTLAGTFSGSCFIKP
jgi:hypothetical protein